jgi:hypothetical protein
MRFSRRFHLANWISGGLLVAALDRVDQLRRSLEVERRWHNEAREKLRSLKYLAIVIGPIGPKERDDMLLLTDEQKVLLSIRPVTSAGHPAKVDGVPVWNSSNPNVVGLQVADDGLSATATSGDLGASTVSVSADADLGEGVRTIAATLDITVAAAEATTLGIEAGTPEVK